MTVAVTTYLLLICLVGIVVTRRFNGKMTPFITDLTDLIDLTDLTDLTDITDLTIRRQQLPAGGQALDGLGAGQLLLQGGQTTESQLLQVTRTLLIACYTVSSNMKTNSPIFTLLIIRASKRAAVVERESDPVRGSHLWSLARTPVLSRL